MAQLYEPNMFPYIQFIYLRSCSHPFRCTCLAGSEVRGKSSLLIGINGQIIVVLDVHPGAHISALEARERRHPAVGVYG